MSHTLMGDQRRGGRGTFHGRQRWRVRPTLLELEGRTLLSTIVVNNPTDSPVAGQTDLRQAIVLANTNGGAETITFDKTVFKTPQTINLDPTLAQLELSDQTGTETITGPNAGVTINGSYTAAGPANSVFKIDPGVTAKLSGLTITGGNNGDYGGGVDNQGTATLTKCTVSGNAGGGFDNFGTATLLGCTISGNPAGQIYAGGGVVSDGGPTTLTNLHNQRQLRRLRRRRGVEHRNDDAHQLHDQRQLEILGRRGDQLFRHDHAHQLHHRR
jgi:hypothetical protein